LNILLDKLIRKRKLNSGHGEFYRKRKKSWRSIFRCIIRNVQFSVPMGLVVQYDHLVDRRWPFPRFSTLITLRYRTLWGHNYCYVSNNKALIYCIFNLIAAIFKRHKTSSKLYFVHKFLPKRRTENIQQIQ
jgi:hypothetical protein